MSSVGEGSCGVARRHVHDRSAAGSGRTRTSAPFARTVRFGFWLLLCLAGALMLTSEGVPRAPPNGPTDDRVGGARPAPLALVLRIDGPVGPAVTNYLDKAIRYAEERGAEVIVIEVNTPGGLVQSMRDIIDRIIHSPVPVATYVSPPGSRAMSAGTFILYASHIAAMAPTTTMGAATPVALGMGRHGGDPRILPRAPDEEDEQDPVPDDLTAAEAKAIEDAVAYIRSLARLRGRNAEWAERAVREAATVTNEEAVDLNVVDLQAADVTELLEAIDGWTVTVRDRSVELATSGAGIEHRPPNWVDELLGVVTNPNIALILMLLGVYGLIFELANPGAVVPGVLGGISLLVALYALNVLPISYAGLALLLLGIALMVAEAFVPSFGILGVGGLIAFALGGVMLFDIPDPAFRVSPWTVGTMTAVSGLVLIVLVRYLLRSLARPVATGDGAAVVGREGEVTEWREGKGWILLEGELWNAEGPVDLRAGDRVRVEKGGGFRLVVRPSDPAPTGSPEPAER